MSSEREVYITNSNYNRLKGAYARLILRIDEDIKQRIYKEDVSWIFSTIEMKYLFAESLIVFNGEGYKLEPSCMVQKNSSHLFDGGAPKYHFEANCEYISKGYTNFEIPPEIIGRGKKEVDRCKIFANENKSLLQQDEKRFLEKLEARFMLKNPPKKVEYSNSGIEHFVKLTVSEMEDEIDKHLLLCKGYYHENPEIKKTTFAPIKKIVEKPFYDDVVKKWHLDYKRKLENMLKCYIRKRDDPGFKFRKNFLDSLGFQPCKGCCAEPPI